MKSLLLWDIDGTLVNADGAGRRAMLLAMGDCFGAEVSYDGFEIAGCTDRQLLEWLLTRHNLVKSEKNFQKCSARYIELLKIEMGRGNIHTYDGVESILQTADRNPDTFQGLLTGNLSEAARVKLDCFDLNQYFAFGAYGEDSADRNALGPIALERARRTHNHDFEKQPERVFVIGDTIRDISCGQAIGASTIAVATGFHSRKKLAVCKPTILLDDFTQASEVFALLNGA